MSVNKKLILLIDVQKKKKHFLHSCKYIIIRGNFIIFNNSFSPSLLSGKLKFLFFRTQICDFIGLDSFIRRTESGVKAGGHGTRF